MTRRNTKHQPTIMVPNDQCLTCKMRIDLANKYQCRTPNSVTFTPSELFNTCRHNCWPHSMSYANEPRLRKTIHEELTRVPKHIHIESCDSEHFYISAFPNTFAVGNVLKKWHEKQEERQRLRRRTVPGAWAFMDVLHQLRQMHCRNGCGNVCEIKWKGLHVCHHCLYWKKKVRRWLLNTPTYMFDRWIRISQLWAHSLYLEPTVACSTSYLG